MEEQGKKSKPNDLKNSKSKTLINFAKYTGISFQMMAVIAASAFIGYKIDEYYNHKVLYVTALASVLGVFLSIYQIIRQLKE